MAKKNSKSVVKRSNKSFILTLATVAILGYFVISLVSLQFQINEKTKEVETARQTLASAQAENAELKELAQEEDEKTYMERIARDVLGYVLPGESVYYDVSTAN
ncbi:MAG: septum formation initiator family protein [Clostridia bacterium]|nr:septum formation initiator family protein [Clostridia bacterium]MBQ1663022.1 septum formation initiator family protein [Clostridia bacterium]MBQ2437914.1 septum formation initiator family protein [Clostridia bacterium]MBQ2568344.1 septum formation initiator family protein [Clostridia bacterium]MBQ3050463.1 septum formation initiator family protein [Clostridia bacterium]